MINTELSACLDEYLSANEEDRTAIRQHIMDENDALNNSAAAFTANVPEGYSNWQEAYNGARSTYVKSLLNRGRANEQEVIPEPNGGETSDTPTSGDAIKISDLFS